MGRLCNQVSIRLVNCFAYVLLVAVHHCLSMSDSVQGMIGLASCCSSYSLMADSSSELCAVKCVTLIKGHFCSRRNVLNCICNAPHNDTTIYLIRGLLSHTRGLFTITSTSASTKILLKLLFALYNRQCHQILLKSCLRRPQSIHQYPRKSCQQMLLGQNKQGTGTSTSVVK